MKIELPTIIALVGVIGGVIFTYGQLTNKVDSLEYLKQLSDTNMNRIIVLETKLEAAQMAFDMYMEGE